MDFDLTDDQRMFQNATRDFLSRTVSTEQLRQQSGSTESLDRSWWSQAASLGWLAVLAPESLGGGSIEGTPLLELSLVAEEIGKHCAPAPLLGSAAALVALVRADGDRSADVEGMISGEHLTSWAVYAPGAGWDSDLAGATVNRTGREIVLSGVRDRVEAGDQANAFVVSAASGSGPVHVLVPRDAAGVQVSPTWSLDLTRPLARVEFDDVRLPASAVLQEGPEAARTLDEQLRTVATLACAQMSGAVRHSFDLTLGWMTDRYSFGRPLASYQALKHRLADSATWLESCYATTAAAALADGQDDAGELTSIAKSFVGERAPMMIQDFVQLHGGIGVTWEHDLHLYLRKVVYDRSMYGTPEDHRRRITALMEG